MSEQYSMQGSESEEIPTLNVADGAEIAEDTPFESAGLDVDETPSEELFEDDETFLLDDGGIVKRLPFPFAKRHGVLLKYTVEDGYQIYVKAGVVVNILSEVMRFTHSIVPLLEVDNETFENELSEAYETQSNEAMQMVEDIGDDMDLASLADSVPETEDLLEQEGDAPIIRLINAILTESVKQGASDIHIETFEKRLIVRYRIDGVLQEVVQPKRALAPLLISRIKVMAKMDIAEKRVPQDGRIALRIGGREIDLRVSTLPSSHGERVVLRLLDKKASKLDLANIGMSVRDLSVLKSLIAKPHGILLVTGPTGSGKTTTLYSALSALNDKTRNIITVEDPIEFSLEGIGQTQVNNKVEMTFAKGLKAILRQDPDVVMIGEIRDKETSEIAVQASLTGHLVLSTLHTNTAIGAVMRMQDMGVEPFLLASSLIGVMSQRLVRTLCHSCKTPYTPDAAECKLLGVSSSNPPTIHQAYAHGCPECKSGYKGRLGIYEVVEIDETLRSMIHNGSGEIEMEKHARLHGPSIRQDGIDKIIKGVTTIEEVLRVSREG